MNIWQIILAACALLILIPVGIACLDASDNALIEEQNHTKASLHV